MCTCVRRCVLACVRELPTVVTSLSLRPGTTVSRNRACSRESLGICDVQPARSTHERRSGVSLSGSAGPRARLVVGTLVERYVYDRGRGEKLRHAGAVRWDGVPFQRQRVDFNNTYFTPVRTIYEGSFFFRRRYVRSTKGRFFSTWRQNTSGRPTPIRAVGFILIHTHAHRRPGLRLRSHECKQGLYLSFGLTAGGLPAVCRQKTDT